MKKILLLILVGTTFIVSLNSVCPDGHIKCGYGDNSDQTSLITLDQTTGTCWGAPHGLYGCWACDTHDAATMCKDAAPKNAAFTSGLITAGSWWTIFDKNGNLVHTEIGAPSSTHT